MDEIKKVIASLSLDIANINDEKYKHIFSQMNFVLEQLSNKVEEVMENQAVLGENIKYLDDDLSDIQEELFEEVSVEELDEIEDEYKEISCKHCNKPIYIESSAINNKEEIQCPYCGKSIV